MESDNDWAKTVVVVVEAPQKIESGEEGEGAREGNAKQLNPPFPILSLCLCLGNVEVNNQGGK